MQRKALLLYLREIRDLEFANWKIEKMFMEEQEIFEKEYKELTRIECMDEPPEIKGWSGGRMFGIAFCLIMIIFSIITFLYAIIAEHIPLLSGFLFFISLLGIGMFGWFTWAIYTEINSERCEYEEAKAAAEEFNNNEFARYAINQDKAENIEKNWVSRCAYMRKEYEKVGALLKANYNLNIIPSQYRNIASIYYIYDYMSSSNASFEETLIHEHMENGIQRIVERLDYVITQNYEIIMQNRRLEAINQQILQSNKEMLKQLENIEEQSYIATQYAELSANYSEATAYFSLANYLK